MKKKMISVIILALTFLVLFNQANSQSLAWKPWGIVTQDGSEIQPFWFSKVEQKDYRIPQDIDLLQADDFEIYIRSNLFSQGKKDSVTIQLFAGVTELEYYVDLDNITHSRQVVRYDVLLAEKTFDNLTGGQNEFNDDRIAIVKINRETFPEFIQANATERIQIVFHEMIICFDHLTNIADIEVTKTYGRWNMELTAFIALSFIFFILPAIFGSVALHKKVGVMNDPPAWYVWLLFFMLIMMLFVISVLLAGMPLESLSKFMITIPPFWLPLLISIWLIFWLTPKFQRSLEKCIFLTVRIVNDKLKIGIFPMLSYYRHSKLELVKKKNDWKHTFVRFLKGGNVVDMSIITPKVPTESENKEIQRVIACSNFKYEDAKIEFKKPTLMIILPFLSLMYLLFSVLIIELDFFIVFVLVIILVINLVIILFMCLDIQKPVIETKESDHRSETAVIADIRAVKNIKKSLKELSVKYAEDMAEMSKNSVEMLGEGLEAFDRAYNGLEEKEIEIDLTDEKLVEKLENIDIFKKVLEWQKSKQLKKKSNKSEEIKS